MFVGLIRKGHRIQQTDRVDFGIDPNRIRVKYLK